MPLPTGLTHFNRRVANKITSPFASRLPGFGVLHHVGRNSGRVYRTPFNVYSKGDHLVVALTYGSDVEWLKNARHSERSTIVTRGRPVEVGQPVELTTSEGMAAAPPVVRPLLTALGVTEFVSFPVR